jgi:hypothetical protein
MYPTHNPYSLPVVVFHTVDVSEAWFQVSRHLYFLRWEIVSLSPNPQPGGPGYLIPFDLSGMGGSTSSYATAGIALRVIWPHKSHHYVKVETPSGGMRYEWLLHINISSGCTTLCVTRLST